MCFKIDDFHLSSDDRERIVLITGRDNEAFIKGFEEIIEYYPIWRRVAEMRITPATKLKQLETLHTAAKDLEIAIKRLDDEAEHFVNLEAAKIGVRENVFDALKQELHTFNLIIPQSMKYWARFVKPGRPQDGPHDGLVGEISELLQAHGHTPTVYIDNIWNKLLELALELVNEPVADSFNLIRAYSRRRQLPSPTP